ncbi:MAG: hypothetical protein CM15mP49_36720 [Actinomycetota bacterium]|nr:MAG: hypothetical protein CM15mP49_36720 [Actinomycetota bacterium]
MEKSIDLRAEYLWIDGTEPTAEIRSKTKILADGDEPGIWGYDGSSTNQATGDNSDVVLKPVFQCPTLSGRKQYSRNVRNIPTDKELRIQRIRHSAREPKRSMGTKILGLD